jgi:hypothetical protein
MRRTTLNGFRAAAVMLVAMLCCTAAHAVILQDDFNGTGSPSGTNWATTTGWTLNGSGLAVKAGGAGDLQAQTSFDLAPSAGSLARESIVFTNSNPNAIMGLAGGTNLIYLRGDYPSVYEVMIKNGSNMGFAHTTIPNTQASGTWQIDWLPNQVQVYFNGSLAFDSNLVAYVPNGSIAGNNISAWNQVLPLSAALHPDFTGGAAFSLDQVAWAVPEPSAMLPCALASTLLVVKRKVRRVGNPCMRGTDRANP